MFYALKPSDFFSVVLWNRLCSLVLNAIVLLSLWQVIQFWTCFPPPFCEKRQSCLTAVRSARFIHPFSLTQFSRVGLFLELCIIWKSLPELRAYTVYFSTRILWHELSAAFVNTRSGLSHDFELCNDRSVARVNAIHNRLLLGHCLRRWPNSKPILIQRICARCSKCHNVYTSNMWAFPSISSTLFQWLPSVSGVGAESSQRWILTC